LISLLPCASETGNTFKMAEAGGRYVDIFTHYLFYVIVLTTNKCCRCASFEVIVMRSYVSVEFKLLIVMFDDRFIMTDIWEKHTW
jgi:hypothetical protein